ncbi:MAG: molybdate ABC transporter permease subunit [Natronincolaceae bacterium]|jgi:molybdate transport system permease protein|nr:molybdate ABC transporter permease subunit [Bacillota bacterium]NLK90116.1 molybdate ABC transporter permease subunit [Clostridiales bacterium]
MDYSPLLISLKVSITATFITFLIGIYVAYLVTKLNKFKGLIDGVLTLPLVLPPTVVGFFLLVSLGKNSIVGKYLALYDKSVVFSLTAAVVASTVVSLPLMYRTTRGAFEQLDRDIIHVAKTLGLSEHKIFLKIMLPNSFPSIMAGTVLAFARALGEFGATIMVAGNIPGKTQTMSVAVYTAVQAGNRHLAYKWVLVMAVISFVAMIIMNRFDKNQFAKVRKAVS